MTNFDRSTYVRSWVLLRAVKFSGATLLWLGLVVLLAALPLHLSAPLVIAGQVSWLLGNAVLAFGYAAHRCPSCRDYFVHAQGKFSYLGLFARRCVSCGLQLGALPPAKPEPAVYR